MEDNIHQEFIEFRKNTENKLWQLQEIVFATRSDGQVKKYVLIGILILLFIGMYKLPSIDFSPRYMLSDNGLFVINTRTGAVYRTADVVYSKE